MIQSSLDFLGIWLLVAGLITAVGAVTVMDFIAWFGRKSGYWTDAAIRSHKVTKPLDWLGAILAFIGGLIFFRDQGFSGIPLLLLIIWIVLCLNGAWLSFVVSPDLLKRESEGRATELLPPGYQRKITASFLLSLVGWWTLVTFVAFVFVSRKP